MTIEATSGCRILPSEVSHPGAYPYWVTAFATLPLFTLLCLILLCPILPLTEIFLLFVSADKIHQVFARVYILRVLRL